MNSTKDNQKENKQVNNWTQRWAGAYTFISCSFWGPEYCNALEKELGMPITPTVFIHKKGNVTFLMKQETLDKIGNHLVAQIKQNPELVDIRLNQVKQNFDILCTLMDKLENKLPSKNQLADYLMYFNNHLPNHVFMKKSLEYMPEEMLKELEPKFKEARFYTEPIYSKTEKFFRALAQAIAKKENRDANLLTCLTAEELKNYIHKKVLPKDNILIQRHNHSILGSTEGNLVILTANKAKQFEESLFPESKKVEGTIAFPGKIKGKVKILLDPYIKNDFQKGDILVTGMTNPDFLPIMEKASAIITDAGGMLCHAAIVARELKTPTIIGTSNATKVLHDGDLVEVDATLGIVKKI